MGSNLIKKQSTLPLCSLQNPFEEPYAAAAAAALSGGCFQWLKAALGQRLNLCVPGSIHRAAPATERSLQPGLSLWLGNYYSSLY